jgi:hypothetical protein
VANATVDGATIPDVIEEQLPRIARSDVEGVATLTIGGNDLLLAFGGSESNRELERAVRTIVREYEECVDAIRARLPNALILLTTVYDPSDGTGFIPGFYEQGRPMPLQFLDQVNDTIRRLSRWRGAALADAHSHFLGHGARSDQGRWYWSRSMIEPSAVGASEIRRLWVEASGIWR